MRRALLAGVLGLLLVGTALAQTSTGRMHLRVRQPVLWSPGYPCMMIVCDDTKVVRVENAQTTLRLTGLKVGSTQCAFWRDRAFRRIIQFDVTR